MNKSFQAVPSPKGGMSKRQAREMLLPSVVTLLKMLRKPRFYRNGGAEGSRTPDLLIANETLYQLSYDPIQENRQE